MQRKQSQADRLVRLLDLITRIEAEISALPPRMREVFEMSRKENLSHRETGD